MPDSPSATKFNLGIKPQLICTPFGLPNLLDVGDVVGQRLDEVVALQVHVVQAPRQLLLAAVGSSKWLKSSSPN